MKRALTSIAAASLVLGTMAPAAFAASTVNTTAKVIGTKAVIVNGQLLSSPYELTNIDSGNVTAYFGVYYFDQAIKALGQGFDATWDGNNHVWNITAPSLDASKIQGGVGTGNTSIYINGVLVKKINTFSHVDPAGGGQTTYFPVYYVNQILGAIGASGQWVATAGLTMGYTVGAPASITLTGGGSVSNVAGTTATISAKVTDANGHPVPGVQVDFTSSVPSIFSVPVSAVTDSHGVASVTGTVGSLEGSVTVTATVDSNVNITTSTTVTVTPIAAGNATVLNADQIQYTFNEPVDPTTAQTIGNYTVVDNTGTNYASGGTAALQSDGRTVIVTLGTPVPNGKVVTFQVKNVQAYQNSSRTLPLYATSLTFNDTTPPAIKSITSKTNGIASNSVTVDFTEPVNTGVGTFVIDGQAAAVSAWNSPSEVVLTPASVLSASTSHTLTVYGLTDTIGNTASPLSQSFSVSADTAQPTVSVTPVGDHQFELTFSKPIAALGGSAWTGSGLSVADESLSPVTISVAHDDTNDPAGVGSTYQSKFIVTITAPTGSLYASSSTRTFTLGLAANSVQDSLGNSNAAFSQQVALHEDTTAPVLTGVTYNTDASGNVTGIVLNSSKALGAVAVDPTKITVIDPNGANVTSTFLQTAPVTPTAGSTKVTLPVQTSTVYSGTYTLYIPAGLVTDNTNDANTNAATTLYLNFGAGTGTFKLHEADINGGTYTATAWNADGSETFTITYEADVYGGASAGSATLPSDYTLNGAALPAGSIVTLSGRTVSITLPKGSVSADNNYATIGVQNVKSTSGVLLTPFTGYVTVFDNTAPVLQSAQILGTDGSGNLQILLTFNEAMTAGGSINVLNNGNTITGTTAAVPGNNKQLVVSVSAGSVDLRYTVQVSTTSTTGHTVTVTDAATHPNTVASGTTVTATN